MVSKFPNNFQINPAVTTLNNSNVVVVWASFDQAGSTSLQDVYAKILSPTGLTISNQFLVNQFINYNQRTPAVAALKNGGFVVTWVSEQERTVAPNLGANTHIFPQVPWSFRAWISMRGFTPATASWHQGKNLS